MTRFLLETGQPRIPRMNGSECDHVTGQKTGIREKWFDDLQTGFEEIERIISWAAYITNIGSKSALREAYLVSEQGGPAHGQP